MHLNRQDILTSAEDEHIRWVCDRRDAIGGSHLEGRVPRGHINAKNFHSVQVKNRAFAPVADNENWIQICKSAGSRYVEMMTEINRVPVKRKRRHTAGSI